MKNRPLIDKWLSIGRIIGTSGGVGCGVWLGMSGITMRHCLETLAASVIISIAGTVAENYLEPKNE